MRDTFMFREIRNTSPALFKLLHVTMQIRLYLPRIVAYHFEQH